MDQLNMLGEKLLGMSMLTVQACKTWHLWKYFFLFLSLLHFSFAQGSKVLHATGFSSSSFFVCVWRDRWRDRGRPHLVVLRRPTPGSVLRELFLVVPGGPSAVPSMEAGWAICKAGSSPFRPFTLVPYISSFSSFLLPCPEVLRGYSYSWFCIQASLLVVLGIKPGQLRAVPVPYFWPHATASSTKRAPPLTLLREIEK